MRFLDVSTYHSKHTYSIRRRETQVSRRVWNVSTHNCCAARFHTLINRSLLNASIHTDITITTTDEHYLRAHTCILTLRAPGIFQNHGAGPTLTIPHPTAVVWRVLQWCYTGDYPYCLPPDSSWLDTEGVERDIDVFWLANELEIQDLQVLAAGRFREWWEDNAHWHC